MPYTRSCFEKNKPLAEWEKTTAKMANLPKKRPNKLPHIRPAKTKNKVKQLNSPFMESGKLPHFEVQTIIRIF